MCAVSANWALSKSDCAPKKLHPPIHLNKSPTIKRTYESTATSY